jgi:hypothetical protein
MMLYYRGTTKLRFSIVHLSFLGNKTRWDVASLHTSHPQHNVVSSSLLNKFVFCTKPLVKDAFHR